MQTQSQEAIVRQKFVDTYVTMSEIAGQLNVSKAAVSKAIARGDLPKPFFLNCNFALWERAEVTPYIERWISKR